MSFLHLHAVMKIIDYCNNINKLNELNEMMNEHNTTQYKLTPS